MLLRIVRSTYTNYVMDGSKSNKHAANSLHDFADAPIENIVTHSSDHLSSSMLALGWSAFFADQVSCDELAFEPMRIATVQRTKLTAISGVANFAGVRVRLTLPAQIFTTDFAVGDWVLVEPESHLFVRRLDRHSVLERQTDGGRTPQLIAANVDTLFIVTSCNDDFNPARLERYLALANQADVAPVIVLTKIDQASDPALYIDQAEALQRDLHVIALNAKAQDAADKLVPWCGNGQTIALVGSSGVGKSTLINTLASKHMAIAPQDAQATGGIRQSDEKGRHTTTSRSLHPMDSGGWVIDTPGMRTLHVGDLSTGLDVLFAEIVELAPQCRFRDCTHMHEPGCAVQAAIKAGTLDAARLERWHKLTAENEAKTSAIAGPRGNKAAKASKKSR